MHKLFHASLEAAADAENFEVTGFETGQHLAFVVSDLSKQDTLGLTTALVAAVRELLNSLETSA